MALYTAHAHVALGSTGRGRTEDGQLDVALRQPKELGGDGDGVNPEQLFAVGYGACFGTTLEMVAQQKDLKADDLVIDSAVSLVSTDDERFNLAVEMQIHLPWLTDDEAVALAKATHQVCPYSNATRGNTDVVLIVNGVRL